MGEGRGHTELPWKWHWRSEGGLATGSIFAMPREGHAYAVAACPKYQKRERWEADATLIVTAVNAYPTVEGLVKALETAIRVSDEARIEWDRTPSGMKAGKLLIALSDPELKYRADITEMHAALSRFRSLKNGGES